ncbi:MAG: FAD/NAD(P)-binding oxidoreductase, partial [Acidobacteria bacterium]|nr:FAD/NAD(P)-binding oxidoreductase [Acidobacteriota bacterium]
MLTSFMERIKQITDTWISFLLQSAAKFGNELTKEGKEDQRLWRQQRLRDLHFRPFKPVTTKRQKIVILGGGSGGLVAATQLGRKLGKDHDVILIDRRSEHIFMPAFLFLMVGQRQPKDIVRNLKKLEQRNVRVIQSQIEGIDPKRQQVLLDSGPISYDYLIISLGMRTAPELLPGFAEAAQHSWELEATLRLRETLKSFEEGRVLIGVPPGPYRCPPAPYEAQWMLDSYFHQRGKRDKVKIEFFTPAPEPAGEDRTPAVWMDRQSKERGIQQHYSFSVQSIDAQRKVVKALYGFELPYDLLFLVPPHQPSQVLLDSSLVETGSGIRVDYDTLVTRWGNVYCIGDCADMPVSKSGGVAHQ